MAGSIQTCPNCGEYVLPPAVQVTSIDMPPYQAVDCVMCGWHGFTEELIRRARLTVLGGGELPPPPPPLELEWISEAGMIPDANPSLSIPGVSITGTESLYFVYIDDFGPGPFSRSISATWNGEPIGENPWIVDSTVRAASIEQDGEAVLWVVRYEPITPGVGTLTISENADVPVDRLVSVFRVKNGGSFLFGAENETEIAFEPPTVMGPLSNSGVDLWTAAVGFRASDDAGEWTGATRVRQTFSDSLLIDVASSTNRIPFEASYNAQAAVENAGAILGYQDNQ